MAHKKSQPLLQPDFRHHQNRQILHPLMRITEQKQLENQKNGKKYFLFHIIFPPLSNR